jgi:GNAT superfamily N-acetyltransferase
VPAIESIRRAHIADVSALTKIRRDAILKLASIAMGDDGASDWANSATASRARRAIAEHEVWIYEQGGAPSGWVEIHHDRIEGLYVRSGSSRRGLGSALLAHAEAQIQGAGHATASLGASPNAEAFYLRRGYRRMGKRAADGSYPMHKPLDGHRPGSG